MSPATKSSPAPKESIRAPSLPKGLEPSVCPELRSGAVVEECRIDDCTWSAAKADSVRFDGLHLVGGSLVHADLEGPRLTDVICQKIDCNGMTLRSAKITRVVFRGCRLTGARLAAAELESVRFIDCQLDYVSFADTRFRNVAFETCQLRDADFHGADLSGVKFAECSLERADMGRAKLFGANVSSSEIGGMTASAEDVRGLIVNRVQASDLAKLFGLVVSD